MNLSSISPRFLKRLFSALLLGPIALLLLLLHPATFFLVVIPAFIMAAYEWIRFVRAAPKRKMPILLAGVLYIPVAFAAFAWLRLEQPEGWMTCLWLLLTV